MTGLWDTVEVDGYPMQVFVDLPDGVGPHPAVIVIMGLGGIDQQLRKVVSQLKQAGFAAVAPDLYHRQSDNILSQAGPQGLGDPAYRGQLYIKMGHLRDKEVEADVRGVFQYLRSHELVGNAPIGITGFCLGGRVAYLMASQIDGLSCAACFYPHNVAVPWGEAESPFEQTPGIAIPVLGLFGENDGNPSPGDRMMLDARLKEYGKAHEFHSYKDVGHGFLTFDEDASARAEASKDAWRRQLDFLNKYLKTPL